MVAPALLRLLPYVHGTLLPLLVRVRDHTALPRSVHTQLQELDLEDLLTTTAAYLEDCTRTGATNNSIQLAVESVERQLFLVTNKLSNLHDELQHQAGWAAWCWSFVRSPREISPLLTALQLHATLLRHRLDLLFGVVRVAPPLDAEQNCAATAL